VKVIILNVEMDAMVQGKYRIPGFRYGEYELMVPGRVTGGPGPAAETGEIRGCTPVNEAKP
jgi:hypothetical protein